MTLAGAQTSQQKSDKVAKPYKHDKQAQGTGHGPVSARSSRPERKLKRFMKRSDGDCGAPRFNASTNRV